MRAVPIIWKRTRIVQPENGQRKKIRGGGGGGGEAGAGDRNNDWKLPWFRTASGAAPHLARHKLPDPVGGEDQELVPVILHKSAHKFIRHVRKSQSCMVANEKNEGVAAPAACA